MKTKTTVLKYLLIFLPGIAGVAYWTTGFAFAFGPGNNFIGWTYFALSYHPDNELAHVFLELVIAATCSTVVSGAVAGRCRMIAYIIYSFIITGNFLTLIPWSSWNPAVCSHTRAGHLYVEQANIL